MTLLYLISQIEKKRQEMHQAASTFGFTHIKTIHCSQELDLLINNFLNLSQYQKTLAKTNHEKETTNESIINNDTLHSCVIHNGVLCQRL
ncbi:Spo0E family sporulation regulatory protein-aspartic acid phosphatase [Bacillus salitolerans]|uniref:Spo0E family sporulation regulatory protein-aspartic acid phosphatase n=1 Tax=Bacillus salitolerans TaxID=1437434 RepID=A0ABW4LNP4_9BACI